jgi:hypothetical protein
MEEYFVRDEQKCAINASFNESDGTINAKVVSLKKWVDECPHLPVETIDEDFLKIMLLKGKFKEEKVKENIKNYFKYLYKHSEFFTGLADIIPSKEVGLAVVSPIVTPSWERIGILKVNFANTEGNFEFSKCFSVGIATAMIMFNYDYTPTLRLILDYEGFTIRHFFQTGVLQLFKLMSIYQNILKMRISGIEIINPPFLFRTVLNILKAVLSSKLYSRITLHENLNSLHENVPKQYLPSDYGGELQSIEELLKLWDKTFVQKKSFLRKIEQVSQTNPPAN